jgi:Tfp pilus assembly protein PilO
MAMSDKERKQLFGLLIVLPIVGIVAFWMYYRAPKAEEAAALQHTVDSLQAAVDTAETVLASGTVEQLNQRIADYEGSLALMRRLVPTNNEVAQLIDNISDRAKLRNVEIADLSPLGNEAGGRFQVARYRFVVLGHYDELGGFLSDIASLPRIMVPHQVSLTQATEQTAQSFGDTTGALLQATFQLRTFVKQPAVEEIGNGGTGGAP